MWIIHSKFLMWVIHSKFLMWVIHSKLCHSDVLPTSVVGSHKEVYSSYQSGHLFGGGRQLKSVLRSQDVKKSCHEVPFKTGTSIAHNGTHNGFRNSMVFHNMIDVQTGCFLAPCGDEMLYSLSTTTRLQYHMIRMSAVHFRKLHYKVHGVTNSHVCLGMGRGCSIPAGFCVELLLAWQEWQCFACSVTF